MRRLMMIPFLCCLLYTSNQVGEGVETNISQGQLNSLVKYQLNTGAEWMIQSVAASGFDGEDYSYSMPEDLAFVIYPDETVVDEIIDLINVVEEGRTLSEGCLLYTSRCV